MPSIAVVGLRGIPATWGGIENKCEEIYSRLVSLGYRVTIYSRNYYTPPEIREYRGMRIVRLPTIPSKHADAALHTLVSLCHALKERYDIIHIYGQGPCLFSWIPRVFEPHAQIFFTCTGLDWQRKKWAKPASFFIHLGEIFSAYIPHYRIAVSAALKEYYQQRYGVMVHHLPNGVRTAVRRPPEKILQWGLMPRGYLLWVGRMVPEKRLEDIIRALMRARITLPLVVVGDSPERAYVESVKSVAGSHRRIRFLGYQFREDLEEIYSHAVAFVTASDLEGLPLTLLEAISYGIPCIASNIPPHQEVLGSVSDFLFGVGDVDALIRHVETLSGLAPEQWQALSARYLARARESISWDAVAEAHARLYREAGA